MLGVKYFHSETEQKTNAQIVDLKNVSIITETGTVSFVYIEHFSINEHVLGQCYHPDQTQFIDGLSNSSPL